MSEEETKQETKEKFSFGKWHDKYHKHLLVIPAVLIVLSLVFLVNFYSQNRDIIRKDVSLTGGTTITVNDGADLQELELFLAGKLGDFTVRGISDLRTGEQIAFVVQTPSDVETLRPLLEEFLSYELTDENSSTEFTGSSLSSAFYLQLRFAIILAFILMAIVVFIIFRSFVPSLAVVLSAFTDIVLTLALVDLLGWKLSSAGIVAFLMLIGYSVDTDIMLTSRVLKRREESVNKRMYSAFKTGLTMTLTSIAAVAVALFVVSGLSDTLTQIFSILTIGLLIDLFSTWVTNAGILKWHVLRRAS
jgi:preprotein translocase subunit SecF